MRGVPILLDNNITVWDDSYNSNPSALESILKSLSDFPAHRRIAVLGDMLELGKREKEYHLQAGKNVADLKWDILMTIGPLGPYMAEGAISSGMKSENVHTFENSEQAADFLLPSIKGGDLILVKGSRGIETEKIIQKLKLKEF